MCGASSQQTQTFQAQQQFQQTLTQAYQQQFAGQQAILNQLQSTFQPILAAGPSQPGFSPAEATALNTQAMESTGRGYANLQKSLAQQQAAQGGGNEFLPSGANTQLQAQLGTSAANQLSSLQNQNLLANYAQGRANFGTAATALSGVAHEINPLGYATSTTQAGEAAGTTANQIAQANNAWMSALGGAIGGIAGGLLPGGGITSLIGKLGGGGAGGGSPADFSQFSSDLSGGGADFSGFNYSGGGGG